MAGDLVPIPREQADKLLQLEEGHFADLKRIEIKPAKFSETVSAFANADGGELFVGIEEDSTKTSRSWRGFPRMEDANAHIQVLVAQFPLGSSYSYEFLACADYPGHVLHVEVSKSANIVQATDGVAYVRNGAQKIPYHSADLLDRLKRNKGITTFETDTVRSSTDVITNSEVTIAFMLEVIPTSEPETWLRKQRAIVDDLPTVGGLVLYADEPQALLPKRCGLKIYRYATIESEGTRETLVGNPISIEGPAYTLIEHAVAKTEEIISSIPRLGDAGLEAVSYPVVTLHEIITNAVLHRDYSITDDIHVRIFDNRVEVESPGTLPGHVTEQNILQERFARNPMIVRLINKFPNPPNKDVGEGLNTAFAAMKRMRLREPEVRQRDHSVVVYIRHTRLASPEDAVMEYVAAHGTITNAIGRDITGLRSDVTMKNVFGRLRDRGLIEQTPGTRGRSSSWRKIPSSDTD